MNQINLYRDFQDKNVILDKLGQFSKVDKKQKSIGMSKMYSKMYFVTLGLVYLWKVQQ